MLKNATVPVIGFVAPSGAGKTSLLKKLIPELKHSGIRLAVVKHSHHDFDIDTPGKDSYELRKSGASQMLIASASRWALIVDNEKVPKDADLNTMIGHLDQSKLDLILVEGFKFESYPKVEIHRAAVSVEPLYHSDPDIIAIATDVNLALNNTLVQLDLNNTQQIAEFVLQYCDLK